jgi:hypothetical protein
LIAFALFLPPLCLEQPISPAFALSSLLDETSLKPSDMTPLSEAPKVVRKMRKFETVETKQDAADLKDVVRAPLFCCLSVCFGIALLLPCYFVWFVVVLWV